MFWRALVQHLDREAPKKKWTERVKALETRSRDLSWLETTLAKEGGHHCTRLTAFNEVLLGCCFSQAAKVGRVLHCFDRYGLPFEDG